jgi:hypothetical protein
VPVRASHPMQGDIGKAGEIRPPEPIGEQIGFTVESRINIEVRAQEVEAVSDEYVVARIATPHAIESSADSLLSLEDILAARTTEHQRWPMRRHRVLRVPSTNE